MTRFHMDRKQTVVILLTLAALGMVVAAPTAGAAPPNIPENSCNHFHWHNGNLLKGELPGYHYHHCYLGP